MVEGLGLRVSGFSALSPKPPLAHGNQKPVQPSPFLPGVRTLNPKP